MLGEIWDQANPKAVEIQRKVSAYMRPYLDHQDLADEWVSAGYYANSRFEHLVLEISGVTEQDYEEMAKFDEIFDAVNAQLKAEGWKTPPKWREQPDIDNDQVRATWVEWTRRIGSKRH